MYSIRTPLCSAADFPISHSCMTNFRTLLDIMRFPIRSIRLLFARSMAIPAECVVPRGSGRRSPIAEALQLLYCCAELEGAAYKYKLANDGQDTANLYGCLFGRKAFAKIHHALIIVFLHALGYDNGWRPS